MSIYKLMIILEGEGTTTSERTPIQAIGPLNVVSAALAEWLKYPSYSLREITMERV